MKQIILLLSVVFFSSNLFAQDANAKYEKAMNKAFAMMKKIGAPKTDKKSEEEITEEEENFQKNPYDVVANQFERIASKEKEKWQPVYYTAFVRTLAAFQAKENKEEATERLADLEQVLNKTLVSDSVKEDKIAQSELFALMGMMYSARISANPMVMGMKLGAVYDKTLKTAVFLNPKNPRAYLLQAQKLFYTPEAFGGNKKKAKILAKKALNLFQAEAKTTRENFAPRWGRGQAEGLVKSIK